MDVFGFFSPEGWMLVWRLLVLVLLTVIVVYLEKLEEQWRVALHSMNRTLENIERNTRGYR